LVIVAVYSSAAFVLGGLFFRHMKRGFADVLQAPEAGMPHPG
jgi:hypothetical protein